MAGKKKVRRPIPGDPNDPEGLGALLTRHLIWLETHHFSVRTGTVRRLQLSRFIEWCEDRSITKAREVTPEIIERYQRHLFYYRKKDGQPLCISSQSHWLTSLRGWFTWMKDEKILTQNPTVEMRLPKEEKRLPRHAFTEEEVEAIMAQPDLSTPTGLRLRALMEVLYSTGMRRFEALNLYASDIDRERGVVLIRNGKGKKDRYTPIGERALAWIDRYLTEARPKLTQDPAQRLLFVTNQGGPMDPNNVSAIVRRYMLKAGVHKAGSCHLFRHTAITLMLDRGADVRHLQEILGHSSLATTQVYTHVSIGKLCEVHAKTHPGRFLRRQSRRLRDCRRYFTPQRWAYFCVLTFGAIRDGCAKLNQWLLKTQPAQRKPTAQHSRKPKPSASS